MPKSKRTARSGTKSVKTKPKAAHSSKASVPRPAATKENVTEEYAEYLERYELYGEGRPRLSPAEFDRMDEEMLDLLALEAENGVLDDDQIIRLQELEYLLLDSEQ